MNSKRYLQLLVAAAVLGSCSEQGLKEIGQIDQTIPGVTFKIDPFESSTTANVFDTRTTVTPGETYNVTWAGGDVIGVFPENGYQVPFQITESQIGQSSAQFDGGYWAIKDGLKYNAYYPINKDFDLNDNYQTHIPVTYAGQQQTGQTCCAGAYDYTYSDWNTAADGTVGFNFHHIGAIVELTLPIPVTSNYTNVVLTADKSVFALKGIYDITSITPVFIPDNSSMTNSISIKLNDFNATVGTSAKIYFMLPPTDMTSVSRLTAKLYINDQFWGYELTPDNIEIEASKIVRLAGILPQYVDLGLSVKWATMNVGAISATDYGDYFAWGEIEPKLQYDWSTYKYCNGDLSKLTKYCSMTSYGNNGYLDSMIVLDVVDDAASANWGGNWRMPTQNEFKELLGNCKWEWYGKGNSDFGGITGYKVISDVIGYKGNFIFLPAAGHRRDVISDYTTEYCMYWSNTLNTSSPNYAYYLELHGYRWTAYSGRFIGMSVRPVCK